ncbi:MAG: hypothetical protein P8130_05945 [Deltaproteobacteria bacterium]
MSKEQSSKEQPLKSAARGDRSLTDEAILRVAKEVVVKFIEVGRLSPQNFNETFSEIYKSVRDAVRS